MHPFGWGQSEAAGPTFYLPVHRMQPSVLFSINVESLDGMNNLDLDASLLTTEDDILEISETLTCTVLGVFYPFPNLYSLTSWYSHHSRKTEKRQTGEHVACESHSRGNSLGISKCCIQDSRCVVS